MAYQTLLFDAIARFAPNRYVQALLILVLFAAAAKIIDLMLSRLVRRLIIKTTFTFDDKILALLHAPILVSIVLLGLFFATERLGFPHTVHFVTIGMLKTVTIFIWAKAAYGLLSLIIAVVSRNDRQFKLIQEHTRPLFINLALIVVFGLAVYAILLAWDVDVTAWVASAGIIGLAISFAAKDTLANLFAGVFILADTPYKVNDMIVLESGERGLVTHIGIRSTRILTRDDVEITVPNAIMGGTKIINETGGPTEFYRIRIKVGVAYGSDIDRVHAVLLDEARSHPRVRKAPKPRVRFRSFGDSSLDHELLCWVDEPVLRGSTIHTLNTAIYKRFLAEKIEIPFPQRDLHLKYAQRPGNADIRGIEEAK
ncbi:MAG: mechanosensitive ion channel [Desulfatitalea sp.]|nr:mechanosensitive ion channel [Desulfatitalea sp.]